MNSTKKTGRFTAVLGVFFVLMMLGIACVMLTLRGRVVEKFSSPVAISDWQQWQQETRRESGGSGPVQRREASSDQPPVLVLMRDHFAACLATLLVIATVIYWTFAFLLLGSLRQPGPASESADETTA